MGQQKTVDRTGQVPMKPGKTERGKKRWRALLVSQHRGGQGLSAFPMAHSGSQARPIPLQEETLHG